MTIERNNGNQPPRNPAMEQALRDAGVGGQDTQAQPGAQQQSQQRQQQTTQQPRGKSNMQNDTYAAGRRTDNQSFTLADQNQAHRRPVSRFAGSQRLRNFSDAFGKELSASLRQEDQSNFRVITLDNNQTRLPVSVVLLVQAASAGSDAHVAVFSLLLDSPDIRLMNRVEKGENRSIEVPSVIGDIYNTREYWSRIETLLGDMLRTRQDQNLQIHDAGGMVVPAAFNLETDNLHELVYRASVATWTVMNTWVRLEDERAFTVAGRSRSELLTARLNFSGEPHTNSVRQPIRSDVVVEMDSSTSSGSGESFLQPTSMLVQARGFVQPMYAQPNVQVNPNGPRDDQPYWAEFVITDVDSGFESADLEVYLLALSTTTILANNYAWADAFRPRFRKGKGDEDLRDIGAMGYALVPADGKAERIDTKGEVFLAEFPNLIRNTFRNGLLYSLDVPEIGENAWALDVFRAAANGDQHAYRQILNAANNLTNGAFGEIFQSGSPMVIDNANRVHLGHYIKDNQLRDIRDIDYLAVLNLFGKTAPKTAIEFAESFSPMCGPLAQRLDNRLKIIHEALQGDYQLTGYANRLQLHGDFVGALNAACDRAGLVVAPANIASSMGSGQLMGGYDAGSYAVRSGQAGGMFQSQRGYDPSTQGGYTGRQRFGG